MAAVPQGIEPHGPPGPPGVGSSDDEESVSDDGMIWRVIDCDMCEWPDEGGRCVLNRTCGLVLGLLAVLVSMLAVACLDVVPPLHYGLIYNHFSKSATTTTVYIPGRYFIGPFCKFLHFPSSVQTVEFMDQHQMALDGRRFEPLHTRTKDGLGLHLQVSLQYQLRAEALGRLYEKFNMAYEDVFVSTVRDTLIRAASGFSAQQLWLERSIFGEHMQAMVNNSLWELYARCWGLQLLLVDLPDNFESSITKTQVQNQLMSTREMEQVSRTIEAETKVIQADFERQVKVTLAGGDANYTVITKEASAKAQQRRIDIEAKVMRRIGFNLGMIGQDLVLYQRYTALDFLEESHVIYGFGGKAIVSAGS